MRLQQDINTESYLFQQEINNETFVTKSSVPTFSSEIIDKKILEDITVVNYFLKVSMIVKITVGYNPEKP